MRNPKRIDEFCTRLAEAWKNVPDWRFFQLISNIQNFALRSDGFYIEDDKAIEEIENYLKGVKNY